MTSFSEAEGFGTTMAQRLLVKLDDERGPRKITATSVKEKQGRLIAYNGDQKVADFPIHRIEHWSLEENDKKK